MRARTRPTGEEALVVIGPTPPPFQGVAFVTPYVIEAVRSAGRLAAHLDTSDPRPVATSGRLDLTNVRLALRHAAELVGLLRRHRGAAVYLPISQVTWGFLRDALFIWIAALFGRRVIVHLHGGWFASFFRGSSPPLRALIAVTMRRVDEGWVLTPAHRDVFAGLVPDPRVRVLENTAEDLGAAIEVDALLAERARRPPRRLLFLSNLIPEKGCFDLLEALELLGERGRGIELRLAGEADAAVLAEVDARAARLAAAGVGVEYVGTLLGDSKAAAFAWADVFVLPSRYPLEGQPLVLLEAMSAGLPAITSDHSGIPHTVRDGKEALIVAPGDPGGLAEALARLTSDPALAAELGDNARRRFESAYRPEVFNRAVAELLRAPPSGPRR